MYSALAVVLIVICFFILFRKQIISLFPRVKSIGKNGVILDSQQKESINELDPRSEAESLMRELDSGLIRELEDNIKDELSKRKLLGIEGVPVLIRYFASMSIAYVFSEIYRLIWGSQLKLLDYLNSNNKQSAESLKDFYDSGLVLYPEYYKKYSFEQWLGFLKDQLLIREDSGYISITVRGREFLMHLTRMGLSKNKSG